jgi:hypothetical protein
MPRSPDLAKPPHTTITPRSVAARRCRRRPGLGWSTSPAALITVSIYAPPDDALQLNRIGLVEQAMEAACTVGGSPRLRPLCFTPCAGYAGVICLARGPPPASPPVLGCTRTFG